MIHIKNESSEIQKLSQTSTLVLKKDRKLFICKFLNFKLKFSIEQFIQQFICTSNKTTTFKALVN